MRRLGSTSASTSTESELLVPKLSEDTHTETAIFIFYSSLQTQPNVAR